MQKLLHQFTLMFPNRIRTTGICFVLLDLTFLSHPYLLSSKMNTLLIKDTGDVRIKISHNYSFTLCHTLNSHDNHVHTTTTNYDYWKQLQIFLHMLPFALRIVLLLLYCIFIVRMENIRPIPLQISMYLMLTADHLLMSLYDFGQLSSFSARFLRKESWGKYFLIPACWWQFVSCLYTLHLEIGFLAYKIFDTFSPLAGLSWVITFSGIHCLILKKNWQ